MHGERIKFACETVSKNDGVHCVWLCKCVDCFIFYLQEVCSSC